MISIIGVGLYGLMAPALWASGIPGRLIITSADIYVADYEPAVTGWRGVEISSSFYEDGLQVSTESLNLPDVCNDASEVMVKGQQERSVYAVDYLVSKKELYSEPVKDGLQICYAGNAKISLEKLKKKA